MAKLMELMAGAEDAPAEERRRMIGAFALQADTGPEDGFVGADESASQQQDDDVV